MISSTNATLLCIKSFWPVVSWGLLLNTWSPYELITFFHWGSSRPSVSVISSLPLHSWNRFYMSSKTLSDTWMFASFSCSMYFVRADKVNSSRSAPYGRGYVISISNFSQVTESSAARRMFVANNFIWVPFSVSSSSWKIEPKLLSIDLKVWSRKSCWLWPSLCTGIKLFKKSLPALLG